MGADARRVVLAIFRKPLTQVALGVAAGATVILLLRTGLSDPGNEPTFAEVAALVGYAAVMFAVCLLACIVPTRRADGGVAGGVGGCGFKPGRRSAVG